MAEVEGTPRRPPTTHPTHLANGMNNTETARVSSPASTTRDVKQHSPFLHLPPANAPQSHKINHSTSASFVICYCAVCAARFGTVINAWERVNSSYLIPQQPFEQNLSDFAKPGEALQALTGGELEGCTITPLSCLSCNSIFAVKCLEAPEDKLRFQLLSLFKVSRMSIVSQQTMERVAPNVVGDIRAHNSELGPSVQENGNSTETVPERIELRKRNASYEPFAPMEEAQKQASEGAEDLADPEESDDIDQRDDLVGSQENGGFGQFEELEAPQEAPQEQAQPNTQNDIIHRLQAVSVYTMDMMAKQKGEIDRISSVMDSFQSEMRSMRALLEDVRREQHLRSMIPPPAAQPEGLPIETLEIFTENMSRIGQKANEVDGLKLQLELMRQRIKRMERMSAPPVPPPVPPFRAESFSLMSPSLARDDVRAGSVLNGLGVVQQPTMEQITQEPPVVEVNHHHHQHAVPEPSTPAVDSQAIPPRSLRRLSSKRDQSAMTDPNLDSARKRLRSAARQGDIEVAEAVDTREKTEPSIVADVSGRRPSIPAPAAWPLQQTDATPNGINSLETNDLEIGTPGSTIRRRGGARRGRGRRKYMSESFVRSNADDSEWAGFDESTTNENTPSAVARPSTRGGRGGRGGRRGGSVMAFHEPIARIRHSYGSLEPTAAAIANGVRLTKKGLPDKRGEAVRRRHAQRKLEREQQMAAMERRLVAASGIGETIAVGKPSLVSKGEPSTGTANGAGVGADTDATSTARHAALMAKIFPEGVEAQRRRHNLVSQLFPSPTLERRRAETAAVAAATSVAQEANAARSGIHIDSQKPIEGHAGETL